MNLLLDTHVLLWWLDDNPTLSKKARAAITDLDIRHKPKFKKQVALLGGL